MNKIPFEKFDLTAFWDDEANKSEYALKNIVSEPPTNTLIKEVEEELGYKLPESYVLLMKQQNGGFPANTCFPTKTSTGWPYSHVQIESFMSLGYDKKYSICGSMGSNFMIAEWGYPPIGIAICRCPSAVHNMIFLDYRECGSEGEPQVVHIDQERDYKITFLAGDFEEFVCGLLHVDAYKDEYSEINLDDIEFELDDDLM